MDLKYDEEKIHEKLCGMKIKNPKSVINEDNLNLGDKASVILSKFGGSWSFFLSMLMLILAWILVNTNLVKFDCYPFILLNLCISIISVLQSPIIMMGQAVQERRNQKRAENAYQATLKNQAYLTHIHEMLEENKNQVQQLQEKINKLNAK